MKVGPVRTARFVFATAAVAALTLGGAFGITSGARAQDTTTAQASTVTVTGLGQVTVTPDTAQIVMGVQVFGETVDAALEQANTAMTAVLASLEASGVEDKDIQTTNFNVWLTQNYDANGIPGEITGYQVSNQVTVTLRDTSNVGQVISDAIGAGANSIYGITFYTWDSAAASTEARKLAMADAKARAEELASAAGMTLGSIVTITETSGNSPVPVADKASAGMGGGGTPVETGTGTISDTVTVTWELVGE